MRSDPFADTKPVAEPELEGGCLGVALTRRVEDRTGRDRLPVDPAKQGPQVVGHAEFGYNGCADSCVTSRGDGSLKVYADPSLLTDRRSWRGRERYDGDEHVGKGSQHRFRPDGGS